MIILRKEEYLIHDDTEYKKPMVKLTKDEEKKVAEITEKLIKETKEKYRLKNHRSK